MIWKKPPFLPSTVAQNDDTKTNTKKFTPVFQLFLIVTCISTRIINRFGGFLGWRRPRQRVAPRPLPLCISLLLGVVGVLFFFFLFYNPATLPPYAWHGRHHGCKAYLCCGASQWCTYKYEQQRATMEQEEQKKKKKLKEIIKKNLPRAHPAISGIPTDKSALHAYAAALPSPPLPSFSCGLHFCLVFFCFRCMCS